MKNKKIKVLSVFLLLSAIGLAGCNNPNTSDSQGSNSTSTSRPASVSTSTSTSTSISIVEKVTATFKNYDGAILWSTEIEKGASVEYKGPTPTRESTDPRIKEYKFTGWDKELTNISEDTVFTAQYSEVVNEYSVTFKNYDGTILFEDTVTYGEDATYTLDTPTKPSSGQFDFAFTGWDKELTNITADTVFTAQFGKTENKILTYKLMGEEEKYISVSQGENISQVTNLVIPEEAEIDGVFYPVKEIEYLAFSECESLQKISIPSTIETIGLGAFDCPNLTYNEYENGCYLGNDENPYHVFVKGKDNTITSISTHADTKILCYSAFLNFQSLETVNLNTGLKVIGNSSLGRCTKLKNLVIPDTVTKIEYAALADCNALEELTIPFVGESDGLKGYGDQKGRLDHLFAGSNYIPETLTKITVSKATIINDNAFSYIDTLKTIILSETVKSIGNFAFSSCSALETVVLKEGLTHLGAMCFDSCDSLKELKLPNSLEYIESGSLGWIDSPNLVCNKNNGANYLGNDENPYIALFSLDDNSISEFTFLPGTKFILDEAFNRCPNLISLELPNTILSLGSYVFSSCTSLENVKISSSIECINEFAFDGCKKLANVELAADTKLKEIGIRAFANCTALNSFDLPDTVERVDNSAFNGCTSLTSFNISATSGLKTIGRNTFEGCSSLKTIVIPATTETVMSNAFRNCSQLTIYCNFDSKPDSWSDGNWNPSACPTYWEGQWSYIDGVPTPNN